MSERTKNKVIDWTLFALDRFALQRFNAGDHAEACLVDHTIELYKEGVIEVKWEDGVPLYSLSAEARIILEVLKEETKGETDDSE